MNRDRVFLGALRLMPKNMLSRAVGAAAHARLPRPITRASIRAFASAYDIDVGEADRPLDEYRTLGDFFTRRLRTGARAIDRRPGVAASPADGKLLNGGRIEGGELIQAKGRRYRLDDLLRNREEADRFRGGSWVTIYLSPKDYHRVHHPVEGTITAARYVPGHLWPVNRAAVENITDLFCVNERLITYIESPLGEVAVVMVGATSVGHILSSYDPTLETNRGGAGDLRSYDPPIRVARGDELGVFDLGSTAVVLFANSQVEVEQVEAHREVRLGESIARRRLRK